MSFPRMYRIRQEFERQIISDVEAETSTQLQRLNLASQISAGQTVAITVGSRGIANIARITKSVVDY
ncbi:[Fe-S]-binding protein, partial [Planctomicrobium sp.]|nr:[Fe-S]-binding protein [Planctomicrobium sp.]